MKESGTVSERARRYTIDLLRADGSKLGTVPAVPNLEPAFEAARFRAVRRGHSPEAAAKFPARVEPVWEPALGDPYLSTLRVLLSAPDGEHATDIPTAYFRSLAEHASARLVDAGLATDGEVARYRVCMFAADAPGKDDPDLAIEEVAMPIALEESAREVLHSRSTTVGAHDADDVAVYVPARILSEIEAQVRAARDVETGGFVLGHLRRCGRSGDVFVEVTETIPALHVERYEMRLVFKPETWRHVHEVIALRRRRELLVSWYHSHPNWCAKCPAENRSRCAFRKPFFSNEDVDVHASCFPRAWQFALLVTDLGEAELRLNMYGWRNGTLTERGFHVLRDAEGETTHANEHP